MSNDSYSKNLKNFIVKYKHRFTKRSFLNSVFFDNKNRLSFENEAELKDIFERGELELEPGTIFKIGTKTQMYAYLSVHTTEKIEISNLSSVTNGPPMRPIDKITIQRGDIENLSQSSVTTTVGRFLLNYLLFVRPFGKTFEYHNDFWNLKGSEKEMVQLLKSGEILPEQIYDYVEAVYYIGHYTLISVPSFTKKSLVTDPKIPELKRKLIEKYKDKLDDPVVIAKIEDTLIEADKKYLEGDPSTRFYTPLGNKMYDIQRKKMHLTVGGIEAFSDDANKTTFIQNSLSEGWDMENFDQTVNEIRKGSYARGVDTAKGGDLTKYIIRIFQDVVFDNVDCKSNIGTDIVIQQSDAEDYIGRKLIGSDTYLTSNNIKNYIGKKIKIRSPFGCKSKNGICTTCIGKSLAAMDHKSVLGMMILVTSTFMNLSMANMHGTKLSTTRIKSIDDLIYN